MTAKLRERYRDSPFSSCPPHMHSLHDYWHPHHFGIFVRIDEPTPTHRHHPKSVVHIMAHSSSWFPEFVGQIYNDMSAPVKSITRGLSLPWKPPVCYLWGFAGGSVVKNLPANAGDASSIPDPGRSPGEGNGNPPQYSCLENLKDRGAWRAIYSPQGGKGGEQDSATKQKQPCLFCPSPHPCQVLIFLVCP